MLCLLAVTREAELVAFDDIKMKQERLVSLFFDSRGENKVNLIIFEALEQQFSSEAKFYMVDKQNDKNRALFENDAFDILPKLFVMIPEEKMAEPFEGPFEKELLEDYIQMKLLVPELSNIKKLNSTLELFANEGFLVFTKTNCSKCDAVIYSVARAAQLLNTTIQTANCVSEDFEPFCKERGIYYSPTIWIVIDGHPTTGPCYTTSQCMETFKSEKSENPEERKARIIPKQETGRRTAHTDPQMLTDTQLKAETLEKKLTDIEHTIKLLSKRKEAATEL